MATNIPSNLQFGSYANFRDPNYQQILQMLGSSQADTWAEWDIEEAERAQEQENWEAEFASSEETAGLAREEMQLNIDNLTAMYSALQDEYEGLFSA